MPYFPDLKPPGVAQWTWDLGIFIDWIKDTITKTENSVIGDVKESYQGIIDFAEMDCGGNWVLYIETAVPALLETMWLVVTPTMGEVLENYLEPKAGRFGGRRGRRGGRRRFPSTRGLYTVGLSPPIPDIDEQVAARIPGASWFKGIKVGATGWLFWTSINVTDYLLWQFLLIQATATFTTHWVSYLMQSGKCAHSVDVNAQVHTNQTGASDGEPCWYSNLLLVYKHNNHVHIGNNGDLQIDPYGADADGWMMCESTHHLKRDDGPGYAQIEVGIVLRTLNNNNQIFTVGEETTKLTLGPGEEINVTVGATGPCFHTVRWFYNYIYKKTGDGAIIEKSATAKCGFAGIATYYE